MEREFSGTSGPRRWANVALWRQRLRTDDRCERCGRVFCYPRPHGMRLLVLQSVQWASMYKRAAPHNGNWTSGKIRYGCGSAALPRRSGLWRVLSGCCGTSRTTASGTSFGLSRM